MKVTILNMSERQMNGFVEYINGLEVFAGSVLEGLRSKKKYYNIRPILDGEVTRQFRANVPLKDRRSAGAFFTGTKLARHLSHGMLSNLSAGDVIADPACGVGDLLLAAARELPTGADLIGTLQIWNKRLMGFDICPEFVQATKVRLLLLAMLRSSKIGSFTFQKMADFFPMICVHDFIAGPKKLAGASHILINPPYNEFVAPSECTWGKGKVSAAAVFMDACVSNASPGAKIGAILPDVLRAGSNYKHWREHIETLSGQVKITTCGQFDRWTDIHVFKLELEKAQDRKKKRTIWWRSIRQSHNGKVGDFFDVHVGPVVPHRHPEKGPCVAYIHAKTLPAWGERERINERRKFSGTLFEPPFVAIRRTSRPGDKRAIATIIKGKRKVAVENHIIALFPNRSTIDECKELVDVLKSLKTDQWLNNRIRCRHLTVESLNDLPWWRLT